MEAIFDIRAYADGESTENSISKEIRREELAGSTSTLGSSSNEDPVRIFWRQWQ
jgi:hypothetical protein